MVDFKIEINKDRVSISYVRKGWPPDVGTAIVFLLSVMAVRAVATWLTTRGDWLTPRNLPVLLVMIYFAGTVLWATLRSFFPSGQSLTCDRCMLTVGRIPRSSLWGQWIYESFPIRAVKELQFGSVAFGGRTPVLGLRFKVNGETKKILAGLECPEAAQILDALAAVGVNVVRDPAMPMMVDMALSHRKHFGGLL